MEPSINPAVSSALETHPFEARREHTLRGSFFERIGTYLLVMVTALLPVVFLPLLSAPFQFAKTAFVLLVILVAFALFIVGRLKEGVLSIPYNLIFGALWLLPVVYLISALFAAPNLSMALLGQRLEPDTVFFIASMALLTTLVPLLIRTKQSILSLYMGLFLSFAILTVYQGLRLILGPDFLSFEIFTSSTSNLLGKWNDLGIFFGLTGILSLITLEGLKLRRISQIVLYGVLIISLFFLTVVNFRPLWISIGLFALGFFIYSFFRERLHGEGEGVVSTSARYPKISILALFVLIIATACAIWSPTFGNKLPTYLGISHLEARPSWQSTADILKGTYGQNAFLGSGPNTFVNQWVTFKPQPINGTLFWNVDFSAGIGALPSTFVTTGILGAVGWILFLGLLLYLGIKALLLRPTGEGFAYYLTFSSFIASLYLWVFTAIYVPNTVLIVFAFFFTGIFLASLRHHGLLKEYRFAFAENPKLGFVSVLSLTVLLILALTGLYLVGQRYVAASYFQSAIVKLNMTGDTGAAQDILKKAIAVLDLDSHRQLAAELQILRLNEVVNSTEGTVEERRQKFQEELARAIEHGQRATELRPENYQNWLTLGRVYSSVVPLQIQGAYDNAKQSYERSKALAPHHPQVYLSFAELETVNQNNAAAKEYLNQALGEKNNYTAAVFLLAQIQIADGDLVNALRSVEAATILDPQNPVVFFQLGLLHYNNKDFLRSISALENAVKLNEAYANARYFLGLAYFKQNRVSDAVAQFERIEALNPDNQEVKVILANLRAGKEPFLDVDAEAPEKRSEPPIDGE